MATETQIRIRRNPYSGYEVWIYGNGELTRRSFDNSIDLAAKLAADCFDDRTIEQACDLLDVYEWGGEPEYPLSVSYRPVAEAAAYEIPYDGCDCETCRSFPVKDRKPAGAITENVIFWLKGMLWIGAVIVPWFAILNAAKWAGVL